MTVTSGPRPSSTSASTSARPRRRPARVCSLFEPLELADEIAVAEAPGRDEVVCEGVEGANLAARALAALREAGWSARRCGSRIEKRMPVAAGLGGGSADAAAVLRLARGEVAGLRALAAALGADVPSQLDPRPALVGGAGELVEPIPPRARTRSSCSQAAAASDRRGLRRGRPARLGPRRRRARGAPGEAPRRGRSGRLAAGLRRDARQRPRAGGALAAPRDRRGALERCARRAPRCALVTGSGPTAFGLFERPRRSPGGRGPARPRRRDRLRRRGRRREAPGRRCATSDLGLRRGRARGDRRLLPDQPADPSRATSQELIEDLSNASAAGPTCWSGRSPSSRRGPSSAWSPRARRSSFGGAVAGQGDVALPLIAITWFAALLGDTSSFLLGRRLGRGFVLRHGPRVGINEERLSRVEDYFDRHGGKTILIGRFIGLVRALAPFIAGSSGMRYRAFVPYSILGTGIWSTGHILVGYFFSRSIDRAAEYAGRGRLHPRHPDRGHGRLGRRLPLSARAGEPPPAGRVDGAAAGAAWLVAAGPPPPAPGQVRLGPADARRDLRARVHHPAGGPRGRRSSC